jgi:hypothetical protein
MADLLCANSPSKDMIHQEHLDRIEDSYIREQERASQMVPQSMLDEVAVAKKQRSQARANDKYETMTSGQVSCLDILYFSLVN